MKKFLTTFYLLFLLSLICACASYKALYEKAENDFSTGDITNLQNTLIKMAKKLGGKDQLLALWELGALYSLTNKIDESIRYFNEADIVSKEIEQQAILGARKSGRFVASLFSNETVTKYEGHAYEKVASRIINSLNYINKGDIESAKIELRKAEEYQILEQKKLEEQIKELKDFQENKENKDKKISEEGTNLIESNYSKQKDYVTDLRNSFENAFAYYLSSFIFEATGEINEAYVYIKKAYDIVSNSEPVVKSYLEISKKFDNIEYQNLLEKLKISEYNDINNNKKATLLIIYAPDFVIKKSAFEISYPFYYDNQVNFLNIALPFYENLPAPKDSLNITVDKTSFKTYMLANMNKMAVKSLQEEMPLISARTILRAVTKFIASRETKKANILAGLFLDGINISTNKADLRSWYSLPAEFQAARISLNPGNHLINFPFPTSNGNLELNVKEGDYYLIYIRIAKNFNQLFVSKIN